MRSLPDNAVNWIAGIVLAGGVVWAGAMVFGPHEAGPDVAALQALADRLANQRGPMLDDRTPGSRRAAANEAGTIPMPRVDYAALRRAKRRLAAANAGTPEPPAPAVAPPVPSLPAPVSASPREADEADEDALKDLALVGVTTADGKDSALLVHVESQERESVTVGASILGFKVKAIEPEAVILTRGAQEHTLRLGDHAVATVAADADGNAEADDDDAASTFGRRRDRGEEGDRGRFTAGFGRGFGDRSFPAADFRTRTGDIARPGAVADSGTRDGGRSFGDRAFGGSGFGTPVFGGGFPGFGGFGSGGNQSAAPTNTFAVGSSGSTTNPQTARRRGTAAAGGAAQPAPISNPQTQRRRGSTAQPAFGSADNTVRQSGGGGADPGRGR